MVDVERIDVETEDSETRALLMVVSDEGIDE